MNFSVQSLLRYLLLIMSVSGGQDLFAQSGTVEEEGLTVEKLHAELNKKDEQIQALIKRLNELEQRVQQVEATDVGVPEKGTGANALDTESLIEPPKEDVDIGEVKVTHQRKKADIRNVEEQLPAADSIEQERLIRGALENTLIDRGGLLLPVWSYSVEPSVSYVHSSSENIIIDGFTIFPVLVVGDIVSERVTRDLNVSNLTIRLGLPWDSQADIRIPYGHQKFRSVSADGTEVELNDDAVGDIELGFSRQLLKGKSRWPDMEASVRYKTDSGNDPFTAAEGDIFVGSGYSSFNVLLTAVKVNDPMVYFAAVDYTLNNSTRQEIGKFEPGNSWGFNIGMAIALNLNNSMSFSYDQHFTRKSKLDGREIPGSYVTTGVFSIGSTYSFTETMTIDFSLGLGITEDSPDVLFTTSMPIRGKLRK